MSTRDQQKRLIARIRTSLITSSVLSALGIAGYLGLSTQSATPTTDTGTTSDSSSTSADTSSGSYFGDAPQVSSGSGSTHARTSGS